MKGTKEFTVSDAEGVDHKYNLTRISVRQGLPIAKKLLAAAIPALARLLAAKDSMEAKALAEADPSDNEALLDAMGKIDIMSFADDIASVIEGLDDKALFALLGFVTRDGIPLDNDMAIDNAYDENWAELYQALVQIVIKAGFLSFFGTASKTA